MTTVWGDDERFVADLLDERAEPAGLFDVRLGHSR